MKTFGITLIDGELDTGTRKHTYSDFGLIMTNHVIPKPETLTHKISIPYMSGTIDLTDAIGAPTYDERKNLLFEFQSKDNGISRIERIATDLAAYIHGKKLLMITDAEPEFFYVVRLEFDYSKTAPDWSHITLKGTAEPFKYCVRLGGDDWLWDTFDFENGVIYSMSNINIENGGTVTLPKQTICTVPEFEVIATPVNFSVSYGGKIYSMMMMDTYYFPQIRIKQEDIVLTFSGSGIINIKFRGRYL